MALAASVVSTTGPSMTNPVASPEVQSTAGSSGVSGQRETETATVPSFSPRRSSGITYQWQVTASPSSRVRVAPGVSVCAGVEGTDPASAAHWTTCVANSPGTPPVRVYVSGMSSTKLTVPSAPVVAWPEDPVAAV